MSDFNYLPFNKTCVYDFSLENIDSYCRTGTVNSTKVLSFINAVLNGCSKKFLTTRDEDNKIKQINDFQTFIIDSIKKSISFTEYKNKTNEFFLDIVESIYNYIENDIDNKNKDVLDEIKVNLEINKIICDIIPIDTYKKIINRVMSKWNDNKNKTFITNIISEIMFYTEYEEIFDNDIETEKIEYIKKHICNFNNIVNNKVKTIINEPEEPNDVNDLLIKNISEYFDCNIYIVDFNKNTTFNFYDYEKDNYIVVISFNDEHYEILGKCLPNNKIQREFKSSDNIVKSFKMQ
uniref:Uncharacterized protein n=1 Tax=viral metagenome TaxID=1070528 RepID=A0A6C0DZZ6_9ZZZZ